MLCYVLMLISFWAFCKKKVGWNSLKLPNCNTKKNILYFLCFWYETKRFLNYFIMSNIILKIIKNRFLCENTVLFKVKYYLSTWKRMYLISEKNIFFSIQIKNFLRFMIFMSFPTFSETFYTIIIIKKFILCAYFQ